MGLFNTLCETSRDAFESYANSLRPGDQTYDHVSEEKKARFEAARGFFENLFDNSMNTKKDFTLSIREPDETRQSAGGFLWQKTVDVDGSGFFLDGESLCLASEFLKNVDQFLVFAAPHPDTGVSSLTFEWRVDDVRF